MELFLDTGNVEEIKELVDILQVDGVTTNPTIVSRSGKRFTDLIKEISDIVGEDRAIHCQVVSRDFDGMIEEAEFINGLHKNIYVKIPVTHQGLKAIKELTKRGIKTTATAVFTAHQATLAAKAGAKYIAPYVNRLDNISGNGVSVVKQIINIIEKHNFDSKVLAASFKNAQQVIEIIEHGVHSVTVPTDVLDKMTCHPLTDYSVDKFIEDWENAYGEGIKTTD
ncbi:fructose-6-phosphate aldolase [Sporosalibacterium faouarense]|uniref:fructose-6-phosphate aldolase n=1 Tax=Sporosalibacterium faouarense TaxID=516123 RepID=UPI00141CD731|nr:fructose-6-phosphate aldolase [Sporosalibacterium faouarense]MTI47546.1 fructose-6-phosphate aldolase [Bacillota bacterium]